MSPFRFRRFRLDRPLQFGSSFREAVHGAAFDRVSVRSEWDSVYRALAKRDGNRGIPEVVRRYEARYGRRLSFPTPVYYVTMPRTFPDPSAPANADHTMYLLGSVREIREIMNREKVRDVMES